MLLQIIKNIKRIIQVVTFTHRIHHLQYSYGYKLPFINYGIFRECDKRNKNSKYSNKNLFKKLEKDQNGNIKYHNCTLTGIY